MTREERDREREKTSGFEAARARLTSIAYRMLGSRAEAEDIVQEAWLKWHAASAGDLHTPLAWLTTVTRRLAIDRIRRLQSEQAARASESVMQPWLEELAPSAEDEVLRAAAVREAVALLFDRLSPDERAAFVLHEAFDYDYARISPVVGKTAAHCRQLAHRARERLESGQENAANGSRRDDVKTDARRTHHIERLREAIRGADAGSAMRLFSASAMTLASAESGAVRPMHEVGAAATASGGALEIFALPPDCGAAFALVRACEIVGLVRFLLKPGHWDDGSGEFDRFALITRGAEIDELNRRFGACAIARLLARIAGTSPTATLCMA